MMLTKTEIEKRLARDEEIFSKLSKERRTVYQRIRRYMNALNHLRKVEFTLEDPDNES